MKDQLGAGGIFISVVLAMELVQGCRNKQELRVVHNFLKVVQIIPLTPYIFQHPLQLMRQFYLSHGLGIPDGFIAAIALESDLVLYTPNVKHFQMIQGLSVVCPY